MVRLLCGVLFMGLLAFGSELDKPAVVCQPFIAPTNGQPAALDGTRDEGLDVDVHVEREVGDERKVKNIATVLCTS